MPQKKNETVTLEGDWVAETEAAVCVDFGSPSCPTWLPKQFVSDGGDDDYDLAEYTISEWLAKEKGLI